jgi:hypothetical protein
MNSATALANRNAEARGDFIGDPVNVRTVATIAPYIHLTEA